MIDLATKQLFKALSKGDWVVLVEVDYMYQVGVGESAVPTVGTEYLADKMYEDSSIPRTYDDCVIGLSQFLRAINRETLQGQYSITVGSLVLDNTDRRKTHLLYRAIDGSEVRVYFGLRSWAREDFYHIFSAVSVKAESQERTQITIELRDSGLLLNKSVGGSVEVGGSGPSANRFRPLNFGFVNQVTPISYDSALLKYVHSDTGTNTAAYDVRDNGVPVGFTDTGDGMFTLSASPAGEITCDVLGDYDGSGLSYRVQHMMQWLIGDKCGLSAAGKYFGPGYADTLAVDPSNSYHLGINISEKRNVIEILDDITNATNSFWAINRIGQFYFGWMRPEALEVFLGEYAGSVSLQTEIVEDDVWEDSARLTHNNVTYNGYQPHGNLNWTRQSTFADSLTPEEVEKYRREGYYTPEYYGEDPGTTSYLGPLSWLGGAPQEYHLTMSEPQVISTLISGPDDTTVIDPDYEVLSGGVLVPSPQSVEDYLGNWSSVRRSQRLPWMEFVDFSAGLEMYELELGHIVKFTYPNWDFDDGMIMQVCSVDIVMIDGQNPPHVNLGLTHRRYAGVADVENNVLLLEDGTPILQENNQEISL